MRIVVIAFALVIFVNSLFAIEGKEKYTKVISTIEKYYYKPMTSGQIINRGLEKFLKTTELLSEDDKQKISIKFSFYDKKYGKDNSQTVLKKIKTLLTLLLKEMFSEEEVYDLLIHSSLESLDAHSSYLDKKHMKDLRIQTEGVFGGLGLTVGIKNSRLTVVSPIDGTPAFRAGLKAGDVILKINELPTENMTIDKAVSLMRGKVDSSINLTILRKDKIISVTIVRALIEIKSVHAKQLPNDILYLRVASFDKKVLKDVSAAIKENSNSDGGIILDLRNNPGGLLDQAIGLADIFMDRGNIITQKSRKSIGEKSYDAVSKNTLSDTPLVILINSGSASASEIVSGALQMHHRATIIGERSFGKGNVQSIIAVTDEEYMKLTIAEYLLADGNSINNIGIKPDFVIDASVVDGDDKALVAAEDYLNDKKLFNTKFLAKAYGTKPKDKRFRNENIHEMETGKSIVSLRNRLDRLKAAPMDKTKWLIAIGIENYEYTADVKYSKKSAQLFSELLQKKYGIEKHHSLILLDEDATMGRIKNKMKRLLRQVSKGDTIYFYYNGHGIPAPRKNNEPYLLPNDVEPEFASDDDFFKMRNIYKLLSSSKAHKVIAVIDSCFSGGNDGKSLIKGVAAARIVPKKVKIDNKKMVILFAGRGTQYSNMYEKKGHRLFSYYIMDSILKGRDDVEMLFNEVFVNVKDESFKMGELNLQEPTILGNKKLKFK